MFETSLSLSDWEKILNSPYAIIFAVIITVIVTLWVVQRLNNTYARKEDTDRHEKESAEFRAGLKELLDKQDVINSNIYELLRKDQQKIAKIEGKLGIN